MCMRRKCSAPVRLRFLWWIPSKTNPPTPLAVERTFYAKVIDATPSFSLKRPLSRRFTSRTYSLPSGLRHLFIIVHWLVFKARDLQKQFHALGSFLKQKPNHYRQNSCLSQQRKCQHFWVISLSCWFRAHALWVTSRGSNHNKELWWMVSWLMDIISPLWRWS